MQSLYQTHQVSRSILLSIMGERWCTRAIKPSGLASGVDIVTSELESRIVGGYPHSALRQAPRVEVNCTVPAYYNVIKDQKWDQ